MKCKLCLENKPLINKSHILSDFLFKGVFDEKHRLAEFRREDKSIAFKLVQTGHYESNLLCSKCDNEIIGNIERYACSKLFSPIRRFAIKLPPPKENLSETFTVDYQRVKLFFLSLLWRMSVTKNRLYKAIDLGKHEEIIRKMIFESNPLKINDYPFFLFSTINSNNYSDSESHIRLLQGPKLARIDFGFEYILPLAGFIVIIRISKNSKVNYTEYTYIDKNNIRVFFPPEGDAKYWVNKLLGRKAF